MITIKKPVGVLPYLEITDPSAKNCPVIVFLHGSGQRGTDMNKLYTHGLPRLLKLAGKDFLPGFTVICPQQTTATWGWINNPNDPDIIKLLKHIRVNYPGDGRVMVTGLSMGGGGAWDAAYNSHGDASLVTAIVPVSTSGDYKGGIEAARRKIPVWDIYGSKDYPSPFPLNEIRNPLIGMKDGKANPLPIETVIIGGGHNDSTWDIAYSLTPRPELGNTTIYEWMLKQGVPVIPVEPPARIDIVKIQKEVATGKLIYIDANGVES